ncbi:hypothetical protein [Synechococcus sp. PCC 7502]|uniref:hypothetical protein n=1 Tax=Synechococcus sp. PCC 7502 TaxID=1173263 RepID=UPI00059E0C06|nr:hypothetical protein [Synechococcus sp. PCC 7502]
MLKKIFNIFNKNFNQKRLILFLFSLIFLGGFETSQSLAQEQDLIIKKIDLSRYGSPSFIDQSKINKQLVVGFENCNLVILNTSLEPQKNIYLDKCGKLFKSRYGVWNGQSIISSAIYSGNASLVNAGQNFSIPIHKAAVTDSFITNNYLISSSDDGSVQINLLKSLLETTGDSYKIYRSIGVARNLAVVPTNTANTSKFAVSYDSGEIVVLFLPKDISKGKVDSVKFQPIESRINALKFFESGNKLIVGYFTGDLAQIDIDNGQIRKLLQVNSQISSLDISSKNIIAIADDKGYVRIISSITGKVLQEQKISSVGITGVLFMDDKTILATDAAGYLYQCNLTKLGN